jgi:polar amino acid transport system ATP-binding protein
MLKPKYLLLDEITSALDIEQAYLILTHLKKIAQNGTSILLVTHNIGFAKTISDRIIFLDNGSIIEEGPRTILFHPKTKRLKQFLDKTF